MGGVCHKKETFVSDLKKFEGRGEREAAAFDKIGKI